MKQVRSDALDSVNRALGLTGAGAPITEFHDSIVEQTLDVGPMVRRGRTPAGTTGLFTAVMRNVHAIAETIQTIVNPYTNAVGVIAPYPSPVDSSLFDLWLLTAGVRQITGSGTLTSVLSIDYPNATQGWGVDNAGGAIINTPGTQLVFWDSLVTQGVTFGLKEDGQPTAFFRMRMRPGATLIFNSTSSAAITVDCHMLLGLFPVTLGQDVFI